MSYEIYDIGKRKPWPASPVATPRPWVGLTDEEIGQLAATHLFRDVWPHSTFAAIHAIEAKLKEKNA